MRPGRWKTQNKEAANRWRLAALMSSWLCSSWPWSIYHPLFEFFVRWEEVELHFLFSLLCEKGTTSTGPQATDEDRETNPNLLHTLDKQFAAHTHITSHWGAFGLNPHLPTTNLAQAPTTSARTGASASPQSSMLTLHISKKVFSKCNPAPRSYPLHKEPWASSQTMLCSPPSCHTSLQNYSDPDGQIPCCFPSRAFAYSCLSYHLSNLFSYRLKGHFSKEIFPNLQNRSNTLKWALPQALNHSYQLPLCELLINA